MSTRIPESLRAQIDATDRRSCCYCLTSEAVSGIPLTYDHITPASRGGLTTLDNVCLAFRACNELKTNTIRAVDPLTQESVRLFHPRQQRWQDHFSRTSRSIRTSASPRRRLAVRQDRLITTDLAGGKTKTAVDGDWRRLLAEHFGIA